MADSLPEIDLQEELARLSRAPALQLKNEHIIVAASGTAPAAWSIEVVENVEYNLYEVRQVCIGAPGESPAALGGSTTQAFNIAESFISAGSISAGTFAVMWRIGDKNVFQVEP